MTFTNKQIAQVFRDAIPFLSKSNEITRVNVNSRYICHSICIAQSVSYFILRRGNLAHAACSIIRRRMGGIGTIECWLYSRKLITTEDPIDDEMVEVQKYRVRWLNALADEFENA